MARKAVAGGPKLSATSRDPDEFREATRAARQVRARAASEVAAVVAAQVSELLIAGDVMGADGTLVVRIRRLAEARQRGDRAALRGAYMDLAVAASSCVAALDYVPPASYAA